MLASWRLTLGKKETCDDFDRTSESRLPVRLNSMVANVAPTGDSGLFVILHATLSTIHEYHVRNECCRSPIHARVVEEVVEGPEVGIHGIQHTKRKCFRWRTVRRVNIAEVVDACRIVEDQHRLRLQNHLVVILKALQIGTFRIRGTVNVKPIHTPRKLLDSA